MAPSFHSKIAEHIVELELERISKRNPSLGFHKGVNKNIKWSKLVSHVSPPPAAPAKDSGIAGEVYEEEPPRLEPMFPDDLPSRLPDELPTNGPPAQKAPGITEPVAIIGAGVAGLRTAMMLKELGIPYVVLEASERFGGRVYTYHFKQQAGERDSKQNYFDVGAMRFPENAANSRTFELFEELGITKEGGPGGKLLPFHLSTDDNIFLYNDIKKTLGEISSKPGEDHFFDGESNGGDVPDEYISKKYVKPNKEELHGVDACLGAAYEPYKFLLARDYKLGWELLMQNDSRSTRAHFLDIMRYPPEVVQWMETRDSGTGAFDDAFTESIIDSLEFDYPAGYDESGNPQPSEEIKWWCIEGGSEVLTKAMHKSLGARPNVFTDCQVTSIFKSPEVPGEKRTMEVTVLGRATLLPEKYSHVVTTIPLSCLRGVNLTGSELDYSQKAALRSLKYGTGVKVGIKFKTRWWQDKEFKKQGGSSKTDRQSRVVVYPNYDVDGPQDSPGVLIATYTWNQDAFRFGSLVEPKHWGKSDDFHSATLDPKRDVPPSEAILLDHIYDDLAEIHGRSAGWYKDQTLDYYAYDWYHNRFTMGGYAFFGPGQFSDLYLQITKPAADGYLHFGGEAASYHHAWVAGALDSAWRCVWEILAKDGTQKQKDDFKAKYGGNKEFENPEVAALQYYRGVYANSLEKPEGNSTGPFHYPSS